MSQLIITNASSEDSGEHTHTNGTRRLVDALATQHSQGGDKIS